MVKGIQLDVAGETSGQFTLKEANLAAMYFLLSFFLLFPSWKLELILREEQPVGEHEVTNGSMKVPGQDGHSVMTARTWYMSSQLLSF